MIKTSVEDLKKLAQEYLCLDKNPVTRAELERLLAKNDWNMLEPLLTTRMTFGTAGLRAAMGVGYSKMNDLTIIQATQGLCSYLLESSSSSAEVHPETCKSQGVVIGHDHRHNSEQFARLTAAVFLHKGFKVYYYNRLTHTPMVPFGIKKLGAACGIMITASHNPKDDNGYKVYWSNACQIISPHDTGIAKAISENLTPWIWDTMLVDSHTLASDPSAELIENYFSELAAYQSGLGEQITLNNQDVKFCYTAMHGVGHEFAVRAFKVFGLPEPFIPVKEQIEPDPDFPTVAFPNPEEGKGALKLAMQTAEQYGAKIIFANDPDADRLAVAEFQEKIGQWHIFTGNELGSILGCICWESHMTKYPDCVKSKIGMLASTVSSKMLEHVARAEGFMFEDTLTGFKWLGNRAISLAKDQENGGGVNVIFAFEEAIGFMVGDIVRDKDGISALAVCAEAAIRLYRRGSTLFDYLESLYLKYGYFVSDNSYFICHSQPTIQKIFDGIRYGQQQEHYSTTTFVETETTRSHTSIETSRPLKYPSHIGGVEVVGVRDLTVGYDSTQPGPLHTPLLPVSSSSQMITFRLKNGCVMTLRTSGTEPKIKYYSELGGAKTRAEAVDSLASVVAAMVEDLLRPVENNLGARKE